MVGLGQLTSVNAFQIYVSSQLFLLIYGYILYLRLYNHCLLDVHKWNTHELQYS